MRTMSYACTALLLSLLPCAASEPEGQPGSEAIAAHDLRSHVEYLASDRMAGRATGGAEIRQAEEYIARTFRTSGLKPLPGRPDYFVEFELFRWGFDLDRTGLTIEAGEEAVEGIPGVDFRPFDFSAQGAVKAEVAFAGYGITAPELDYDDYAGLDVTGKLVLIFRHEPNERDPESPFDGTGSSAHARFDAKASNARRHGAAGMLVVTDPLNHADADDLRVEGRLSLSRDRPRRRNADEGSAFLAVQISRRLADAMVDASGRSLAAIQRAIDRGARPEEVPLAGVSASLRVESLSEPELVGARNVIGFVAGKDPVLKDEWILVGAHHDHIGRLAGRGDTVFNGADDNASGTSAVLELARAVATNGRVPGNEPLRSLVFATFSAEERGLLGSRALLRDQILPLERIGFMLNLDMIGRNPDRPIQVYGDGYAAGLRSRVEAANSESSLPLRFAGRAYAGNSDHDPFFRRGIPFMFFFTGVHLDYHRLGDHPGKLSYPRMGKIVNLAYRTLMGLAGEPELPRFVHHVPWLGVEIQIATTEEGAGTPVVTVVRQGSRGAQAGIRQGDRILTLDGAALETPGAVGERLRRVDPGHPVRLALGRGGEEVPIVVGRRRAGFLGVVPAAVDSEARERVGLSPWQGVLLSEVLPRSPAARGGAKAGDILIRVAGQGIGLQSLRGRLAEVGAGERVKLTVIRDGARIELEVVLGER